MLDVSVSYERYKFIGYEFLTWLWFLIENNREAVQKIVPDLATLEIGNRIVLENRVNEAVETITIKGDDAGLEEGILSLKKGAVVIEMNLSVTVGDQTWRFTLKGESLSFSSLKVPETAGVESKEDIDGAVLEKVYLFEKIFDLTDKLYHEFVKIRISDDWETKIVPKIKNWIFA